MTNPIKYSVSKPILAGRERDYVLDAIDSGWISSIGPYLEKFERGFASIIGVDEALAVSNGTVALHLACLAMNLQQGQDVIVPAMTYVATANSVVYCNANPVFVDVDPHTWNTNATLIEKSLTPNTVGVIAVHLYGMPAPVEEIKDLCRSKNLWLIEDCAESLGATLNDKLTGSFGDAATFSFYGNKIISTGEGGMVLVSDPEKRKHARMLRGQGMDLNRRYWHPMLGYNYRMTNVAAAIGLGQIECFDYHIGERRRVAASYLNYLAPLQQKGLVRLPAQINNFKSSYWLFSLVIEQATAERRITIQNMLEKEQGIETRPFFVPLHQLPMYQGDHNFPVSEALGQQGLNLPTYAGLSDDSIRDICAAFEDALLRTA